MSRNKHTVAHAWAHQQSSPTEAGNVSFNGPAFYSYGTQIAYRVSADLYLTNETGYSSSTATHLSAASRAATGIGVPVAFRAYRGFRFSSQTWPDVFDDYLNRAGEIARDLAKRRSEELAAYDREAINSLADSLGLLMEHRKSLPISGKAPPSAFRRIIKKIREMANVTDEQLIEIRQRLAKQRREQAERRKATLADKIEDFRNFRAMAVPSLEFAIIRIEDSDTGRAVRASNYTTVPLGEALTAYRFRKLGNRITGIKLGPYTIVQATEEYVKIGCTKIEWAEIEAALSPYMQDNQPNESHE